MPVLVLPLFKALTTLAQLSLSSVGLVPELNQPSLCRLKLPLATMSRLTAWIVPDTLMLPSVLMTDTLPSGLTTAPKRPRSTGAEAIIFAKESSVPSFSAPPKGSTAQVFLIWLMLTSAVSAPDAPLTDTSLIYRWPVLKTFNCPSEPGRMMVPSSTTASYTFISIGESLTMLICVLARASMPLRFTPATSVALTYTEPPEAYISGIST